MGHRHRTNPIINRPQKSGNRCFYRFPLFYGLLMMRALTQRAPMKQLMQVLNRWIGSSVGNAFGNPLEERQHQPPLVGVQPYRDQPLRH